MGYGIFADDNCPDFAGEEFEEEYDDENEQIVRAKWSMDGAKTLSEAASLLRCYADNLMDMEREGWQLIQPIEDDYGFIRKKLV